MCHIRFFECATPQERILALVRAGESFDNIKTLIEVVKKEINLSQTLIEAIRLSIMNLNITIKISEEKSIGGLAEQLLALHKKLYPQSYPIALQTAIHVMMPLNEEEVSDNLDKFDEIFFEGDVTEEESFEHAVAQYNHFLSLKESKEENNHYYLNLMHLHYISLQSMYEISETYHSQTILEQFKTQVIQETWNKLPDALQKNIKRALPENATWEDYRNVFGQCEEFIFTIELLITTNKKYCSIM